MKKTLVAWLSLIGITVLLATLITTCDGSSSKYDVVYDDDGLLGYSDSFWEWLGDQ